MGSRYPGLVSLSPGVKITWPRQLAHTHGNSTNSYLKSHLIILNIDFKCIDNRIAVIPFKCIDKRIVVIPAFTYFFFLYGKGIGAKILWPEQIAPNLRKSCKQSSDFFFLSFLKQYPIKQVI